MAKKLHLFVNTSVLLVRVWDKFWRVWTGAVLFDFLWLKVCSILFFLIANLSLVLPWTVFLRGLMLFYVLGGVEQRYLFVLCIVKRTVSMISWMVTLFEGCGCVLSWHSRSCCHCCVDSSVLWSYLSVLVKSTCLAAFQNKHLTFGVGQLMFVGPTLCKICARIYGAWLSLTWNTTKRYSWWDISKSAEPFRILLIFLKMCAVLALKVQCWSVCLNATVAPGFHHCRRVVHSGFRLSYWLGTAATKEYLGSGWLEAQARTQMGVSDYIT